MRIAIAGISHEALIFSPIRTTMPDFRIWRGQEVLDYPGVAEMVQKLRIEPIPLLIANSLTPSGFVEEKTYLQLRAEILQGLQNAGKLDGICLVLHGAMLVENIWSGETDLVREIRAVVGNDVLISVRLDMHANLTEEFANKTDIWAGYRTAPHRDQQETLERALSLLVQCLRAGSRPQPVFIRVPLLLQGEKATTGIDPMHSLLAMTREIEKQPGILNAEVLVGFGWADAPHAGSNIVVTAEGVEHLPRARQEARRLAQAMWDRCHEFTFDQEVAASADEAIDRALQASESTVFISDSGDNPTAGATGDVPYFLSRLLAKKVPDAILASIPDKEAAQICFRKGIGATVHFSLGGKLDTIHGDPVLVTGTVQHLYQPAPNVKEAAMATVQMEGVHIIITDIRKHFTTLEDFRKAGLEPLTHKIVVVKLGYLMPALRDAAPREILALTPGYADMELTRLPYKYVTRPCFPLDKDFAWRPIITNRAGYSD
jgi:microcystin degradation protein MlrC